MSKIKLLLDVVSDMRSLADSLQAVADAMMESNADVSEPITAESVQPTIPESSVKTKPQEPPAKLPSLEDVRSVLGKKSAAGFSPQVRELISKYGASHLSKVDPANFPALLKDAEAIGNAAK